MDYWEAIKPAIIIILFSFGIRDFFGGGHLLGIVCLVVATVLLIA